MCLGHVRTDYLHNMDEILQNFLFLQVVAASLIHPQSIPLLPTTGNIFLARSIHHWRSRCCCPDHVFMGIFISSFGKCMKMLDLISRGCINPTGLPSYWWCFFVIRKKPGNLPEEGWVDLYESSTEILGGESQNLFSWMIHPRNPKKPPPVCHLEMMRSSDGCDGYDWATFDYVESKRHISE